MSSLRQRFHPVRDAQDPHTNSHPRDSLRVRNLQPWIHPIIQSNRALAQPAQRGHDLPRPGSGNPTGVPMRTVRQNLPVAEEFPAARQTARVREAVRLQEMWETVHLRAQVQAGWRCGQV